MQKELKKTPSTEEPKIDPSQIKGQFSQMNQQAQEQQPLTEEQLKARRIAEEAKLDEMLPYLRKQKETYELQLELTRLDCLMGNINPSQIPWPVGKQLETELLDMQLQWSQRKMDQQDMLKSAMKEKNELLALQKKEHELTIQGQAEKAILDKYKDELEVAKVELEKTKEQAKEEPKA